MSYLCFTIGSVIIKVMKKIKTCNNYKDIITKIKNITKTIKRSKVLN